MSHIRNPSPPSFPSGCETSGILLSPPFYPGVSHLESFSAAIPSGVSHTRNPSPPSFLSGCLTLGILLPPPFHPGVLEFFSAAISSECLTPGILLRRHSIRMSHIQNPSPPPFHPGVSHPGFLPRRRSTFSGCLTSGTLSSRRSSSFFILRAFQNRIFNKALLPLLFMASNFSYFLCF